MAHNRRAILAALKTKLEEIAEITTVVRTYLSTDFDITQYAQAELPLIVIPEPGEDTDQECTSQMSMMVLETNLKVYFLDWAIDPDETKFEALVKKIRDKIGNNFTLSGTAEECRVASISPVTGILPVYDFLIGLEMRYQVNELSV